MDWLIQKVRAFDVVVFEESHICANVGDLPNIDHHQIVDLYLQEEFSVYA